MSWIRNTGRNKSLRHKVIQNLGNFWIRLGYGMSRFFKNYFLSLTTVFFERPPFAAQITNCLHPQVNNARVLIQMILPVGLIRAVGASNRLLVRPHLTRGDNLLHTSVPLLIIPVPLIRFCLRPCSRFLWCRPCDDGHSAVFVKVGIFVSDAWTVEESFGITDYLHF